MMFHPKWLRALMVLVALLCLFTVGLASTPSAHAAGVSLTTTTTTKTTTFKASARLCAFLQKSLPTRAGDAHLCDITIIATNVVTRTTGVQAAALSPNACYPVINHSATYNIGGWLYPSAGFSQSETFTYGCTSAPVITNHQCYGVWTRDPSILMWQANCTQYPNGSGHTQAEDDMDANFPNPRGYSDGQPNASIYDWCQC